MVGVALRLAAHVGPLRDDRLPEAALVEGLDDVDGGRPARNRSTKRRRASSDHGVGIGRCVGQSVEGVAVDPGLVASGGHGDAQHEEGLAGRVRAEGELHRAFAQDDPGGHVAVAEQPAPEHALERGADAGPEVVAHPGDGARRGGERPHHGVGVGVPERGGDRVLLLEQESVAGPAGAAVQLDPGGQQREVGGLDLGRVAVEEGGLGLLGPADGVDVAQAAAAVLEVGLEEEGHLAGLGVAVGDALVQLAQPPPAALLPERQALLGELVGQGGVTGDVAHAQHRRGRVEVVGGEAQGLLDRAHGVAELQVLVPDRVPDALGEALDLDPGVVEEVDVDVAARGQLGAPVAAHGDEGGARGRGIGLVPQGLEPLVDGAGERPAQLDPAQVGVVEDGLAVEAGGHRAPGSDGVDGGLRRGRVVRWRRSRARRSGCARSGRPW